MIQRVEVTLTLDLDDATSAHPGEWDWRKLLKLGPNEGVIVQSIVPLDLSDGWH